MKGSSRTCPTCVCITQFTGLALGFSGLARLTPTPGSDMMTASPSQRCSPPRTSPGRAWRLRTSRPNTKKHTYSLLARWKPKDAKRQHGRLATPVSNNQGSGQLLAVQNPSVSFHDGWTMGTCHLNGISRTPNSMCQGLAMHRNAPFRAGLQCPVRQASVKKLLVYVTMIQKLLAGTPNSK